MASRLATLRLLTLEHGPEVGSTPGTERNVLRSQSPCLSRSLAETIGCSREGHVAKWLYLVSGCWKMLVM
jgi:hypothetical protein